MPYTTHGLMTRADMDEYFKDSDRGSLRIDVADWPDHIERPGDCPVCGDPLTGATHDAVQVDDASGQVYGCLRHDCPGWVYLGIDDTREWWA